MNNLVKVSGISMLMLGLGMSTAFAMSADEARQAVSAHSKASKWEDASRAEATAALDQLMQQGVPVDVAADVVNACVDKGIRGPELAGVVKDIEARMDKGASAEAAARDTMSRFEQRATATAGTTKDAAANAAAKRDQVREEMHGQAHDRNGMGGGYGAGGFGAGGAVDMGGMGR